MKHSLGSVRLIVEIAVRNLFANRVKTLILGGVGGCAALLIVVGGSLLSSVDQALQRSITGSLAGHIQVYSARSKDELQVMGDPFVEVPDLAPLQDFAQVRRALLAVPNVAAVVPMGFHNGEVSSGSALDQALAELRETANGVKEGASLELLTAYAERQQRVRRALRALEAELGVAAEVSDAGGEEARRDVTRAASEEFWARFPEAADTSLEFLESRVAPLAIGVDSLPLRYVGTDPAAFAEAFPHARIVDGSAIPRGQRGFLFAKRAYEEQVKLKAAYGLDYIKQKRDERRATIANDPDLRRVVDENVAAVPELLLQLDTKKADDFRSKLQATLGSSERDVAKLLASFLATDDDNFDQRFAFFYRALAPELNLYRFRIGDALTIRSVSKNGYARSVNVRLFGTYTFTGLEKAAQAGAISMLDLVTFRELYGFATAEQEREVLAMRSAAGARDVDRSTAEAELFGSKAEVDAARTEPSPAPERDPLEALRGTRAGQRAWEQASYDPAQLEQGSVLNAAVIVAEPGKVADTIEAIERMGAERGLPLKAISWQQASGLLGQFVTLMRGILLAAVVIIFVVTLVVINNALVMASLDRVPEIGALRAIGAQRSFIFCLLLAESVVIGVLSGGFGAGLGALLALLAGKIGVPADGEFAALLFSGQRLFPTVAWQQLWVSLSAVVAVSAFSGIYPARLALQVSPRQAMSAEE